MNHPTPDRGSPVGEQRDYAQELFAALQELGAHNTNAVLEVLGDHALVESRRYPPEHLRFGGAPWRAYYHCHAAPARPHAEHGHFHVFVPAPDPARDRDAWSHLVAMAVDAEGQPLQWFTVNQWVTGGPWLGREQAEACLDRLPPPDELTLAERWLVAMLGLYRDQIGELLIRRDAELHRRAPARGHEDREVYGLARKSIALLDRLRQPR